MEVFISNDIKYAGVNDHKIDLFEGQYKVENGMAYNSYVILDQKIAVFDTVDVAFTHECLRVPGISGKRGPRAQWPGPGLPGGAAHGA